MNARRLLLGALAPLGALAFVSSSATADSSNAVGPRQAAASISVSSDFTCVVLDDGTVRCWGNNGNGRLATGDENDVGDQPGEMGSALPAIDLPGDRAVDEIVTGSSHVCALFDDGSVACWGSNSGGQLGLGGPGNRGDSPGEMGDALPTVSLGTGRTATALAAGGDHTCAVLDNGSVKCWGANGTGQLGLGDVATRGDGPGEMGDALPTVSLGTGRTATAVSAGESFTCAILDDRSVKCWGTAQNGRIGLGIANPTAHRGDGPGEMGDALPAVDLGTGEQAAAISSGVSHTCVVLVTARVKCWGFSGSGELGYGNTTTIGDAASEMGNNLPAVSLGRGRRAVAVSAGSSHTCVLLANEDAACWGNNGSGRLGIGNLDNIGDGPNEMGDSLRRVAVGAGRRVAAVAAGESNTCVVLDNGRVTCVGSGSSGALGFGSTDSWGSQPTLVGDALPVVDLPGTVAGPRLTVGLDADSTAVVVGATVTYTVSVENTGGQTVRDIEVRSGDVPSCDRSVGALDPGESTEFTCAVTTDVGNRGLVTNQVLVSADRGGVRLSRTVRTSVAAQMRRPDGLLRVGTGPFVGSNTYSTTAARQTRATTVRRRGSARFTLRVQNDGNVADSLRVAGATGNSAYRITYRRGSANITGAVRAGTYTTGPLAPGARHDITVIVRASRTARAGSSITRAVTVSSTAAPTLRDVVSMTVTRR